MCQRCPLGTFSFCGARAFGQTLSNVSLKKLMGSSCLIQLNDWHKVRYQVFAKWMWTHMKIPWIGPTFCCISTICHTQNTCCPCLFPGADSSCPLLIHKGPPKYQLLHRSLSQDISIHNHLVFFWVLSSWGLHWQNCQYNMLFSLQLPVHEQEKEKGGGQIMIFLPTYSISPYIS